MAKSQTQESGFSTLGVQNNLACFCKSKLKQMFTSNLDSRYSVVSEFEPTELSSFCQVFCQVYSVTLDGDTITCFYTVSSTLRDKQQNQKQWISCQLFLVGSLFSSSSPPLWSADWSRQWTEWWNMQWLTWRTARTLSSPWMEHLLLQVSKVSGSP